MVRSNSFMTSGLLVVLLFTSAILATDDDWQWQISSSAPEELVPDVMVNFSLSAPDSQIQVTIDSNVTSSVLVSWNATYSWYFPPPSSNTVQRAVSIPFLQTPHVTISILNPQNNDTIHTQTPEFSQLATLYSINIAPLDGVDSIFVDSSAAIITCSWADENNTLISSNVAASYNSDDEDFSCQFSVLTHPMTYKAGQLASMSVFHNLTAISGSAAIPTAALWTGVLAKVHGYICGNHSSVTITGAFFPNRTYACIFHGKEPHLSNYSSPAADGSTLRSKIILPYRGDNLEIIDLLLTAVYEKRSETENGTLVFAFVSNSTDTSVAQWECETPWYRKYLPVIIAAPVGFVVVILSAVALKLLCARSSSSSYASYSSEEREPLRVNTA